MSTLDNSSPQYFVRHWRKPETEQDENVLDGFLFWLEYSSDSPSISKEELHEIELLVDQYLKRDIKKLEAGEREMLKAWKEAAR